MQENAESLYFKQEFGSQVFEGWGGNVEGRYHELVDYYIKKNKEKIATAVAMKMISTDQIDQFPDGEPHPTTCDIVREIEGSFEVKIQYGCCKKENLKLDALADYTENFSVEGIELVNTKEFLLDIICNILYKLRKELKTEKSTYCDFSERNTDLQDRFVQYKFNGRRVQGYEKKTVCKEADEKKLSKITFDQLGYPTPGKGHIIFKKGARTKIENVIPNFYRMFVLNQDFCSLFNSKDLYKFRWKEIYNIFQTVNASIRDNKLRLNCLECYKIEDFMGIELGIELTKVIFLTGNLVILPKSATQNELQDSLRDIVTEVMEWKGGYSRRKIVEFVGKQKISQKRSTLEKKNQVVAHLKSIKEEIRVIKSMVEYQYVLFYELMETLVTLNGDTILERIDWTENQLLRPLISEPRKLRYEIDNIQCDKANGFCENENVLYSVVQRDIIQYSLNNSASWE